MKKWINKICWGIITSNNYEYYPLFIIQLACSLETMTKPPKKQPAKQE